MHQIAAKFMPCVLSEKQKKNCARMGLHLEERTEKRPKIPFEDNDWWYVSFMGMTQKPSNICLIRRVSSPCSLFFSTFMELWIMILFHKDNI